MPMKPRHALQNSDSAKADRSRARYAVYIGHGLSKTARFNGSQPDLASVFFIAIGQLGDLSGHIDDALLITRPAAKCPIALNRSTTPIRRPSVRDKPLFNWSILDTAVFTLAGFILLFALWTLGSWLFMRVLA